MFRIFKTTKSVNIYCLRNLSTNQKIIDGINKSANILPKLNPLE